MRRLLLGVAVLAACATVVDAHHSIAGVYDSTQRVTIDGVVARFQFVNPHPFVVVTVSGGVMPGEWRVEMDNKSELADVGVTTATLKPGDRVVVSGSPARDRSQSLYVSRLDRPQDGFWYEQVGSSPRIG